MQSPMERFTFKNPFLSFKSEEVLSKRLIEEFSKEFQIPEQEIRHAVKKHGTNLPPAGKISEKRRRDDRMA
mgnify:CR=1 FL=1